jgi:hypothetical protein
VEDGEVGCSLFVGFVGFAGSLVFVDVLVVVEFVGLDVGFADGMIADAGCSGCL